MKLKSSIPFLPFFIAFLLVGYWTGHQIAVSAREATPVAKATRRLLVVGPDNLVPTPTPLIASKAEVLPPIPKISTPTSVPKKATPDHSQVASRQRNLLVIGVDDLASPHPNLESVWLVIYMPGFPRFMLLPVYPSLPGADDSSQLLAQLFQFDDMKSPEPAFLDALEEKGLWWTGYLILDRIALIDVIEFLGGAGEFSALDGANTVANLPKAMDDPQQAFTSQVKLFQELCSNVARLSEEDHWRLLHLFGLIPDHAISNLDLEQVSSEWQDLLKHAGEVACEFPSLSQASIGP